jgi:hypothetical protein
MPHRFACAGGAVNVSFPRDLPTAKARTKSCRDSRFGPDLHLRHLVEAFATALRPRGEIPDALESAHLRFGFAPSKTPQGRPPQIALNYFNDFTCATN